MMRIFGQAPAVGIVAEEGFNPLDQFLHAEADLLSGNPIAGLGVIGAQHDDDQVQRGMGLYTGSDIAQSTAPGLQVVLKCCGTAVHTLLHNMIAIAQQFAQQTAPALIDGITGSQSGNIAMGIGIAKAQDLFHSNLSLPLPGPFRAEPPNGVTAVLFSLRIDLCAGKIKHFFC